MRISKVALEAIRPIWLPAYRADLESDAAQPQESSRQQPANKEPELPQD